MGKNIFIGCMGLVVGVILGYFLVFYTSLIPPKYTTVSPFALLIPQKQVIGFLPYWLISKSKEDYSEYITTLTYFGLTVNDQGNIKQYDKPGEQEPGYSALTGGLANERLSLAKKKGIKLSLLIFSERIDSINTLVSEPQKHAHTLVSEVFPIMKKYGFSDLNLDIESVDLASEGARVNMTEFVKQVKREMDMKNIGTLTIEISPTDIIKKRLIDPAKTAVYADYVVVMAYDYHYIGSLVTGAVAPLYGAGTTAEFDTQAGIEKTLDVIPEQKVIVGVPLYGYEWETVGDTAHSGVIPGTGITASNMRAETFLSTCATCSAQWDKDAKEKYVIYKDQETDTYHQIFIPDARALQEKIHFADQLHLGGIALWALGYEGHTILDPLKKHK